MTAEPSLREQLLRLETALATRDDAHLGLADGSLGDLIAEDFSELGASGRTWTADEVRATLASEPPRAVTIEAFEVACLADGVVLATYRSEDPRPANRSSIWVRRGDRWVMRFHQGTLRPEARG